MSYGGQWNKVLPIAVHTETSEQLTDGEGLEDFMNRSFTPLCLFAFFSIVCSIVAPQRTLWSLPVYCMKRTFVSCVHKQETERHVLLQDPCAHIHTHPLNGDLVTDFSCLFLYTTNPFVCMYCSTHVMCRVHDDAVLFLSPSHTSCAQEAA